MSRLPAPSKLTRPGGLVRPTMPPPSSRPNLPNEASVKKRAPGPRGPTPNQANLHVQRSQDDARSTTSVQSSMSEVAHDFVVGSRVLVGGDRPGVIAFLGTTLFSRGEWAGVILDEALGKNDGVVQGVQYFQCEPNHGVFARPQKLIPEPSRSQPQKTATKPSPKDGHNFQVGDAVLVSGTKPGAIAFLGPTQFAKGVWAGVVMEKPEGKNDGTVLGVSYFQCPPQHGLFARLHNLTPIQSPTVAPTPPPPKVTNQLAPVTNAAPPNNVEQGPVAIVQEKLRELQVGDRVLVGGAKMGLLKYVGRTDFAKGIWAGIELDEAIGKNDGAVAGKRYFQCPPQHGLFAPLPRVEKVAGEAPAPVNHPPTSQTPQHPVAVAAATVATSVSAQRSPRGSFGVSPSSSLNRGAPPPLRHTLSSSTIGSVTSESLALSGGRQQELDTRGMSVEEQVQKLTQLLSESEQRLIESHAAKEKSENEKEDLNQQVSALTRKLEDLQFQMEEEAVKKIDQLKADSASTLDRVTELEEQLRTAQQEKDLLNEMLQQSKASANDQVSSRISELEQQMLDKENVNKQLNQTLLDTKELLEVECNKTTQLNNDLDQATSSSTELSHMIQQLQEQLGHNNEQLSTSEAVRTALEQQMATYEEELNIAKTALQNEKEIYKQQLTGRTQETDTVVLELRDQMSILNDQLSEKTAALDDEIARAEQQEETMRSVTKERDNALVNVTDLEERVSSEVEKVTKLNSSTSQLKQRTEELLVTIQTEQERCRVLGDEKLKLEEQITLLRSETGDSSQQLSFLDLQLKDKERELNEARNSNSELVMECTKIRGELSAEKDNCSQEIEKIKTNYWSQVKELNATIDDLKAQVDETKKKYDRHKTQCKQEKEEAATKHREAMDRLTGDVEELRTQLSQAEVSRQQAQEQLEEMSATNKSLEAKVAGSSSTSDEMAMELSEERSKVSAVLKQQEQTKTLLEEKNSELRKCVLLNEELNSKLEKLIEERDTVITERNKLVTEQRTLAADKEALMTNLSSENKSIVEQRDNALAERDQLQTTCATLKKNCSKVEKEKAKALEEREKAMNKVQEVNMKYDSAQMQLADLNENLERVQNELYSIQEQREQDRLSLEQKLEKSESRNTKLQRKLEKLNSETEYTLQESKSTLEALEEAREINQKLEDQLKAAGSEVEELEMKVTSHEAQMASMEATHSAELKAIQQRTEAAESSLTLKESELNRAKEKIAELSEYASGSNEYMSNTHEVALLEEEKLLLEERVKELTVSLEKALEQEKRRSTDIAEDIGTTTSGVSSRLQALQSQLLQVQVEKNEMAQKVKESDQQIEFLGTVIQDFQGKLEAAEALAGLGPPPDVMEDYQLDSDEEVTFNQQPAPRLFCDICDTFDDHDTDDCPLQAQTSESPLPSMHHGSRHSQRPYCENCEMFDDHWTEDCQYDVTY